MFKFNKSNEVADKKLHVFEKNNKNIIDTKDPLNSFFTPSKEEYLNSLNFSDKLTKSEITELHGGAFSEEKDRLDYGMYERVRNRTFLHKIPERIRDFFVSFKEGRFISYTIMDALLKMTISMLNLKIIIVDFCISFLTFTVSLIMFVYEGLKFFLKFYFMMVDKELSETFTSYANLGKVLNEIYNDIKDFVTPDRYMVYIGLPRGVEKETIGDVVSSFIFEILLSSEIRRFRIKKLKELGIKNLYNISSDFIQFVLEKFKLDLSQMAVSCALSTWYFLTLNRLRKKLAFICSALLLYFFFRAFSIKIRFISSTLLLNYFFLIALIFFFYIGVSFLKNSVSYGKYNSVNQRFWKTSFSAFWMIEFFLFFLFTYLTLIAPNESLVVLDEQKVNLIILDKHVAWGFIVTLTLIWTVIFCLQSLINSSYKMKLRYCFFTFLALIVSMNIFLYLEICKFRLILNFFTYRRLFLDSEHADGYVSQYYRKHKKIPNETNKEYWENRGTFLSDRGIGSLKKKHVKRNMEGSLIPFIYKNRTEAFFLKTLVIIKFWHIAVVYSLTMWFISCSYKSHKLNVDQASANAQAWVYLVVFHFYAFLMTFKNFFYQLLFFRTYNNKFRFERRVLLVEFKETLSFLLKADYFSDFDLRKGTNQYDFKYSLGYMYKCFVLWF